MTYQINPQIEHILIWHSIHHDHMLTFVRNGRVRTYGYKNFSAILRTIGRCQDIAKINKFNTRYYYFDEHNPEHKLVEWKNH